MSKRIPPPSPPYLGPAKFHGGAQALNPLKRVTMHGTVSPCQPGMARIIARYFRTTTRPASAHYVVDPNEVVQVVGDHQIAYHAPPNSNTIGVELCDPVAGPKARWDDPNHTAMLHHAAMLVAQLCLAYDLPIRQVGPIGLRLGRRGIAGHDAVSKAWRQTTHTDPGPDFPWRRFMGLVKDEADKLKGRELPPVVAIPPRVPASPTTKHMHLVTSNIKNYPDLTRDEVRADTRSVSALGGVIGWQEIAEDDDRNDLRTSLPDNLWTHTNLEHECPISLLSEFWEVVSSGSSLLHKGLKGVSPDRYASWVQVTRKGSTLPPVIVLNTHWVNKAFEPGVDQAVWRLQSWNAAHAAMTVLVQDFLSRGLTVLGTGDYNRRGVWPGFADSHRWLMHGGLDHLWVCEALGGMRVTLELAGTLSLDDLFTDHPARWVHVALLPPLPGKVQG